MDNNKIDEPKKKKNYELLTLNNERFSEQMQTNFIHFVD